MRAEFRHDLVLAAFGIDERGNPPRLEADLPGEFFDGGTPVMNAADDLHGVGAGFTPVAVAFAKPRASSGDTLLN